MFRLGVFTVLFLLPTTTLAQGDPRVELLGRLLASEDRRALDPALLEEALRHPDPVVRRQAALGAGRIQDHRAGGALLAMLEVADTTSHADAMFALGLLGDSTLAAPILARLADPRALADGAVIEAPGTLAKLGTGQVRTVFSGLLDGTSRVVSPERRQLMLPMLLGEGWRLGRDAPVNAAIAHLRDTSAAVRWRAAYLLGRTRAAVGTRALLGAAIDTHPWVRQSAVRGLVRASADSAQIPRESIVVVLAGALRDSDPGVRINALGALSSWADSALAHLALPLLGDAVPNVRLQAATTLGALRGGLALAALRTLADAPGEPLVLRREALLGLLHADTALVAGHANRLARSNDPRERLLAIELAAQARQVDLAGFAVLLHDPDAGVRASALSALPVLSIELDVEILVMATALLEDSDPRVRSAAWSHYARRAATAPAVAVLVAGWERELARGRAGATGPIVGALRRLHGMGGELQAAVEREFLATTTPPADYLLRRSAGNWPALAERWGAVFPVEVGRDAAEYRRLAERYLTGTGAVRPRVQIVTEGRGELELELLGDQAPLTVDNFLRLVEAGFFDGGEWHRVVPNFVVQDGAGPRESGVAGPPPIRDEFNRVRYDQPVLGMALSGPDAGTSQWFINLSPQPHLDGGYTVFGRLIGGFEVLGRILQGDRIRSIRY